MRPYAGFWRRLGAFVIDGWILGAFADLLLLVTTGGLTARDVRNSHSPVLWLSFPITMGYFTLFVGAARGQTLGMRALGVRVVSADGAGAIGYGRAFVRWITGYLSMIPLFLGFLWMLWDREKQCWHDKFASTYVVRRPS